MSKYDLMFTNPGKFLTKFCSTHFIRIGALLPKAKNSNVFLYVQNAFLKSI